MGQISGASAIDAPSKLCIMREDLTTETVKVKVTIRNIVLVAVFKCL